MEPLVGDADLERDPVLQAEPLDLLAELRLVGTAAHEDELHVGSARAVIASITSDWRFRLSMRLGKST